MFVKALKTLLFVSLLAIAISQVLNNLNSPKVFAGYWYFSVIFFAGAALLINFIFYKSDGDPRTFVFKIMSTSMLRLLLCMIGIFIYSIFDKAHFLSFAIHFGLHYILFTIFEISYLIKYTKTKAENL